MLRSLVCAVIVLALGGTAFAQGGQKILKKEPPAGALRAGQTVLVDDGSCPAGQILALTAARRVAKGEERGRRCVPR